MIPISKPISDFSRSRAVSNRSRSPRSLRRRRRRRRVPERRAASGCLETGPPPLQPVGTVRREWPGGHACPAAAASGQAHGGRRPPGGPGFAWVEAAGSPAREEGGHRGWGASAGGVRNGDLPYGRGDLPTSPLLFSLSEV